MLVHEFNGLKEITGQKIFKPVTKITIVAHYSGKGDATVDPRASAMIRIRLIDQKTGETRELVPETRLEVLAEISAKYEGFQHRAAGDSVNGYMGYDRTSVLIGEQLADGEIAGVDLSNDKYLDIDLRGLDADTSYQIFGFETHKVSGFMRKYNKFYMSVGEKEKTFNVGQNELLVLPIDAIHEVQFYPLLNTSSPVYRSEELRAVEDENGDILFVYKDTKGVNPQQPNVHYGGKDYAFISVSEFTRFDVRRTNADKAVELIMIDYAPNK